MVAIFTIPWRKVVGKARLSELAEGWTEPITAKEKEGGSSYHPLTVGDVGSPGAVRGMVQNQKK